MIPADYIVEWRASAPWPQSSQVEQDLLLSRALVELFQHDEIAEAAAFRGGTALYKLHLPPARYSEDIDLVQTVPGPIGPLISAVRAALDPWLGEPKRALGAGGAKLRYRIQSEDSPPLPMRLKVEIATREHFNVLAIERRPFAVRSRWFSGTAAIQTYHLDELLGTKLRALYQRKKGRDLFDLWWAMRSAPVEAGRVVECFRRYMANEGNQVSRAEFEANLAQKLADPVFHSDLQPLLAAGVEWNVTEAADFVGRELLTRLPGEGWKGGAGG